MYLEVLNPLFGYTKGSVVEAMLQVQWEQKHHEDHAHVHEYHEHDNHDDYDHNDYDHDDHDHDDHDDHDHVVPAGDGEEHLAAGADRQRGADAEQARGLLPLHDLRHHRDIQVDATQPD